MTALVWSLLVWVLLSLDSFPVYSIWNKRKTIFSQLDGLASDYVHSLTRCEGTCNPV